MIAHMPNGLEVEIRLAPSGTTIHGNDDIILLLYYLLAILATAILLRCVAQAGFFPAFHCSGLTMTTTGRLIYRGSLRENGIIDQPCLLAVSILFPRFRAIKRASLQDVNSAPAWKMHPVMRSSITTMIDGSTYSSPMTPSPTSFITTTTTAPSQMKAPQRE